MKKAYAPKSQGPLGSALNALARFAAACPARTLFLMPTLIGDVRVSAHNEWTLILFAWYLLTIPSPTTGKPVALETVKTYVSLAKGFLSFRYSFTLVNDPIRLKQLYADLANDQPVRNRKKRRAFRRRHLRRAWRVASVRATDPNSINDFAAVSTAWHVLARGGELCPSVPASRWTPDHHPTRADLTFHVRKDGTRYAVLWLRPLKKKGKGAAQKIPQYIAEYDGQGSDTYAALKRLFELDPVPEHLRASTPLFRRIVAGRDGSTKTTHMTVCNLRTTIRRFAALIGEINRLDWGAHSARIGGATDLASCGKSSELLLKAKGRWASDIFIIYSRLTARQLLGASAMMQSARGRDLEEIIPAFTQPA